MMEFTMLHSYFQKLIDLISKVEKEEAENIRTAAEKISQSIQAGGIIHVFGCGHSHMLAEELFYRAGGLAVIHPILIEELMLHKGAVQSSQLEKENDYVSQFMANVDIRTKDVVIVASTSGRNPVPIDVAQYAKQKGAYVLAITSLSYKKSVTSRHKDRIFLTDASDLTIDNHILVGDALMTHKSLDVPFGPGSTVVGAAIVNAMMVEAVNIMCENQFTPPVFKSGNVDGCEEFNENLVNRYKSRIPLLDY
jgi:uncharacterized phosphosugar-binding protein